MTEESTSVTEDAPVGPFIKPGNEGTAAFIVVAVLLAVFVLVLSVAASFKEDDDDEPPLHGGLT